MLAVMMVLAGAIDGWAQEAAKRPSLVLNGSFEEGLRSWATEHPWYELPQGSGKGTSRFSVEAALAREGKQSACVVGQDNRGIILQDVAIRREPHRLSGWIKCQGLGEASATINIEWVGEGGKWLAGEAAGSVSGDADWTFVSEDVTPAEGAVIGRVECLTNTNNGGKAWFDDVRLVNIAEGDGTPPPPIDFRVRASNWLTGALNLEWLGYAAPDDLGQCRVYAATEAIAGTEGLPPVAIAKSSEKAVTVRGLKPGVTYNVAVVPVDLYANAPDPTTTRTATPGQAGAPRVEVTPLLGPTGALAIRLKPALGGEAPPGYVVRTECEGKRRTWKCGPEGTVVAYGLPTEADVSVEACAIGDEARVSVVAAKTLQAAEGGRSDVSGTVTSAGGAPVQGATVSLVSSESPRLVVRTNATGEFVFTSVGKTPGAARVFATADGCLSAYREVLVGSGKLRVSLALAAQSERPWDAWTATPPAQVFGDAQLPGGAPKAVRLVCGRNESECAQIVVRPRREVKGARVIFEDLQQEGGRNVLSAANFQARFVSMVHVEKNSTATPPEELVRRAPADFPDELSDDEERDLPANQTQPIFLTFNVPTGTAPGTYSGNAYVQAGEVLEAAPVSLEVVPVDFPDDTRLWVVNWFSTDVFTTHYGLEAYSDEWWGMLREHARMFRRYHQNAVTVSPGLCRIYVEADGSRTYDWSRFDRWCELFLSEGARRLCITHLGGRKTGEWECPEFVLSDRPATVRATGATTEIALDEFLKELQKHLERKGWLDIAYQHIADEPIPVNVDSWKRQSDRVHKAAPKLKRMDAIQVPDLRGFCELYVPQLNYFDQWYDQYERWHREKEYELWFYVAWVPQGKYPNRLIDTETIKPRIIHWMNYLYDSRGYLHWGLNHWNIRFATFAPGDEWMVWPGRDLPNSSLRYEAQRDGLEDCEYLAMLEDAQREAIGKLGATGFKPDDRSTEIGRRVVRSITDYTKSYEELEAAREDLLRGIAETKAAPLALVRTEPNTSHPIAPGEVNVYGIAEAGCSVTVNGQPVQFDGNRFLARVPVSAQASEVSVVIRKGRAEKTITRRFAIATGG
ncbi:MAG: DUF4091 domain-containing protein [Armatimonadetes bacterium]|nr:DUF4091 domain-containing protein [Armatimonadota bacterium]